MYTQLVDPHKEFTPGGRWASGHPGILFPYGALWQTNGTVWAVLELAEMGSLKDHLEPALHRATVSGGSVHLWWGGQAVAG